VVSGNVSFYNETQNKAISPTPTIGGVGLIKNLKNMVTKNIKEIGSNIVVIGKTKGHLYQSEFFREVLGVKDGPPPEVNLFNEKNNGLIVLNLISKKLINSIHDISSGGLLVSLAEMCIHGNIGAKIKIPRKDIGKHQYLFGEDQSRYLVEIKEKNKKEVSKILEKNGIYYDILGKSQKDSLDLDKEFNIKLENLNKINSFWFKNYFKED
jgi:phosphoribosylformylglycinamidine synthase